jgi:hypothetical protein
MNFEQWRLEISRRAFACGGTRDFSDKEQDAVIAAAAVVLAKKGPEWCASHPEAFKAAVGNQLGAWVRVALWIARLFMGSNPILLLLGFILPVIVDFLVEHIELASTGACAAMDWNTMGKEAEQFMKGA